MATSSIVTTICDNCGTREQRTVDSNKDDGWRHETPTLYSNSGIYATAFSGNAPDYCPACCMAVSDAIAAALDARKVQP